MKVLISVDMEGVAGVATLDQVVRGGHGYPRAMELMTAEANAAIEGAFAGGATEVVVDDSHATMDNLLHTDLDPRARLTFGLPRAQCMVQGVDAETAAVLFIGYHAPAGCAGVLAHTFTGAFTELRLNGTAQSEASVNALICAAHRVPVAMLTGDDMICAEARQLFPGAEVVEVKRAEGFTAATSLHPREAQRLIRQATERAVRATPTLSRPEVPGELVLELDFPLPLHADYVALSPGFDRVTGRGVRAVVNDIHELAPTISAAGYLASIAATQMRTAGQ